MAFIACLMFGIAPQHRLFALLAPQQPTPDHALNRASSVTLLCHTCPGSAGQFTWQVRQRSAVKVQAAGSLRQHGGLLEGYHRERLHG